MSAAALWVAVACLAGALQAAPSDAPSPWEGLRDLLSPDVPQDPPRVRVFAPAHREESIIPQEDQWWAQQQGPPHPGQQHPTVWLRHLRLPDDDDDDNDRRRLPHHHHQVMAKRQKEILSAMEKLQPGDHHAEMVKRAISLWVTLHPLTAVPSLRPPVSPNDVTTNGRRPYGQLLRWGR